MNILIESNTICYLRQSLSDGVNITPCERTLKVKRTRCVDVISRTNSCTVLLQLVQLLQRITTMQILEDIF